MDEFKAQTEFGRRYGFELRKTGDWWRLFGGLPGWSQPAAGLLASQLDVAFWSALPAALTTPEPVVEEPREVELTDKQAFLLALLEKAPDGVSSAAVGPIARKRYSAAVVLHELEALGRAHVLLDGDEWVAVAGQPETACGRMVAGCKP